MEFISLLLVAFLFGGMLLFSLGFGTLAFKFLDVPIARKLIRNTFPFFYLYVFSVAIIASSTLVLENFDAFLQIKHYLVPGKGNSKFAFLPRILSRAKVLKFTGDAFKKHTAS